MNEPVLIVKLTSGGTIQPVITGGSTIQPVLSGGVAILPVATADILGGIKVGENLTIEDGVLSATLPEVVELPVASEETLGGVTVGDSLTIEDGVLSVDTADSVEEEDTRPVTSAAVYAVLGDIASLLSQI